MYIPDPTELMDSRIDRLAFEFESLQKDVPAGSFRCPECREIRDYEPITLTASPDSEVCCYECLPPETKAAYDEFCRQTRSSKPI